MTDVAYTTLAAVAGTVLSGFVATAANLISGWLERRHAMRRMLAEQAIRVALDRWRQIADKAEVLQMPVHRYGPGAMDGYLIRAVALAHLLQRRAVRPRHVRRCLADLEAIGGVLEEQLKRPAQKSGGNPQG